MNELEVDDKKMELLRQEITERENALKTADGQKEAAGFMLAMFDYFANSGYKMPDVEFKKMASVYVDQLKEHIVGYGYTTIKFAAREFVRRDTGSYHLMPTAGQLIEVIEDVGGNVKAALARYDLEKFIEADTKRVHDELMSKGGKNE